MSYGTNTETARKALVEAEEVLRDYFAHSIFDSEREKQLCDRVNQARTNYIDQLEILCPQIYE